MESSPASPQNAVLQHAQSYVSKAQNFDAAGDFSNAQKAYEDGLRLYNAVLASACSPGPFSGLRAQVFANQTCFARVFPVESIFSISGL